MIGEKLPVIMYIDPVTFSKIEEVRGDISRSKFVGKIVEKTVTEILRITPVHSDLGGPVEPGASHHI